MKIGKITTTNKKGQIVIPKKIRDQLSLNADVPINIFVRGNTICLKPIDKLLAKFESEEIYEKILQKTQGAWSEDKTWDETQKRREAIELDEAKKRKNQW
jgi:AbrB family looped-hinge helix DNA binding protein